MGRHQRFGELSPEVGELDADAMRAAIAEDADDALPLLMAMARATDEGLRRQVRALAPRLVLDRARTGMRGGGGTARLRSVRADRGGDLDLDASLGVIAEARAEGRPADLRDLQAHRWERPQAAVCLLLDRSGSMEGRELATAALASAACALHAARAGSELAIVAFDARTEVLHDIAATSSPERVVERVMGLRGHGVTSLDAALRAAARQLARARAPRRVTLLLSDCLVTDDLDPVPAARALPDLRIVAPAIEAGADAEARRFARAAGARVASMARLADLPRVLEALLD